MERAIRREGGYPTRAPHDAHQRAPLGRGAGRRGSRQTAATSQAASTVSAIAARWRERDLTRGLWRPILIVLQTR